MTRLDSERVQARSRFSIDRVIARDDIARSVVSCHSITSGSIPIGRIGEEDTSIQGGRSVEGRSTIHFWVFPFVVR